MALKQQEINSRSLDRIEPLEGSKTFKSNPLQRGNDQRERPAGSQYQSSLNFYQTPNKNLRENAKTTLSHTYTSHQPVYTSQAELERKRNKIETLLRESAESLERPGDQKKIKIKLLGKSINRSLHNVSNLSIGGDSHSNFNKINQSTLTIQQNGPSSIYQNVQRGASNTVAGSAQLLGKNMVNSNFNKCQNLKNLLA